MGVRPALILGGSIVLAFAAAACGGSGGGMNMTETSTPVTPDSTVTIRAQNVTFTPEKLTVPAGKIVELKLENMDATEHDFQVDGLDADVMAGGSMNAEHGGGSGPMMVAVHAMPNEMSSVTFMAKTPGTYNFWCTIAGHKDAGMTGTITVE